MGTSSTRQPSTLYERLGGRTKLTAIVDSIIRNHVANPIIAPRFTNPKVDLEKVQKHALDFFCAGAGGPETYSGRDMRSAHTGMNISEQEFIAGIDDILAALNEHGVGAQERQEVLAILYSLKSEIVRV